MKSNTVVLTIAVVALAVGFIAGRSIAWRKESPFIEASVGASIKHGLNGVFNGGIGDPYQQLMKHLRRLHDSGQIEELGRALKLADTRSGEIYEVWLSEDRDKYRLSLRGIIK